MPPWLLLRLGDGSRERGTIPASAPGLRSAGLGGYRWVYDDDHTSVKRLAFSGIRRYRVGIAVTEGLKPTGSDPMRTQPLPSLPARAARDS